MIPGLGGGWHTRYERNLKLSFRWRLTDRRPRLTEAVPHVTTSELIVKLERDLAHLQHIPEPRRADELADVREEVCRSMLKDLLAGRPLVPDSDRVRR